MAECELCGHKLPRGCYGMSAEYKECQVKAPDAPWWRIGMAIWKDLGDRAGIKHELRQCEPEIQAEIVKKMGRIAIRVMQTEKENSK